MGPTGPAGPAGPTGATGATGADGTPGVLGNASTSTTTDVSIVSTTLTWVFGVQNFAVAANENVLILDNFSYAGLSTTSNVVCATGQCTQITGIFVPCHRPNGTTTPTAIIPNIQFRHAYTTTDIEIHAAHAVFGQATFATAGNYDVGLCARRVSTAVAAADFAVVEASTRVIRYR